MAKNLFLIVFVTLSLLTLSGCSSDYHTTKIQVYNKYYNGSKVYIQDYKTKKQYLTTYSSVSGKMSKWDNCEIKYRYDYNYKENFITEADCDSL